MRFIQHLLLVPCLLGALVACSTAADQVISTQTRVLTQDPNNVSALIERGDAFNDKADLASALIDLNKAIQLAPDSFRAFQARGVAYLKGKQYENALTDFNHALELNPELSTALALRGQTRVLLERDFQAALNDLTQAEQMGARSSDLFRYKGLAQFRLGQREAAIASYIQAAEIEPENLAALNEAIAIGLDNERIYLKRGTAQRLKKDYSKAITDFNQVIKLNPQNALAYEERADAYYATGDCEAAEKDLQTACRLSDRKLCSAISLSCSTPSAEPSK